MTTSRYTEPETEYEFIQEKKRITSLRPGESTNVGIVTRVARGHKFVTVFRSVDGHEIQMWRVPLNCEDEVTITIRRQTQESRDADRLYWKNTQLERLLASNLDADFQTQVARLVTASQNLWAVSYNAYERMMAADCSRQLWREYKTLYEYQAGLNDVDHATAHAMYIEQLKESLITGYTIRGNSRSTNQLSNLLEDIMNEAIVTFIRDARYY